MSANTLTLELASSMCKFSFIDFLFCLFLKFSTIFPWLRYNKTDVATPFGGFKESGFGKDLGREALNEYMKTKTITFEYSL